MIKVICLLWDKAPLTPAQRRDRLLNDGAKALLALDIAGLQMNIVDDRVDTPSPAPRLLGPEPFVAQVNLWLEPEENYRPCVALLEQAGFRVAAYAVDEWLYTEYGENRHSRPRTWPDGQRSPGILAVTLLAKPPRLARDEWMRRWFGWQSPMSEWMQPRARYVRNVVTRALTEAATPYDGIVEEAWPSREHVTNPFLFYGASNIVQLLLNMATMLRSVTRILQLWKITTVMTSEYFVKTPVSGRQRDTH